MGQVGHIRMLARKSQKEYQKLTMWETAIRGKFFIWEEIAINVVCYVQMGTMDVCLILF